MIKSHSFQAFLFAFVFLLTAIGISAQMTVLGTLNHDGLTRDYRLRLPANHDKNVPIPLVLNFHGFGSNANEQEFYSYMNAVADTAKFAVCYPNGIEKAWNVGWEFGSTANDVDFVATLIDELVNKYGFNTNKVYACGMSNGGFMSYVLACELNTKIAAIASVTGSMVPGKLETCTPGKAIPVMEIHGTADSTVVYNGSPIAVAIPEVLTFWQNNNGCDTEPIIQQVPNTSTTDGTTSEKWTYVNCDGNQDIIHYKVFNGAHTWPGALLLTGVTSKDFNASVVIWNFFKRYSLDGTVPSKDISATEEINVYPSPFGQELIIDAETAGTSIKIYDIKGSLMISKSLDAGKNSINTDSWSTGTYLIHASNSKGTSTTKVVK